MANFFERAFEGALWRSRWIVLPAVIASVVSAMVLVALGVLDVALVVYKALQVTDLESFKDYHRQAVAIIIAAVDVFLIAMVMLIFGIGIYELFISKIDAAEADARSSRILVIKSLDQLKETLAKVIVMILIVTYFKEAVLMNLADRISALFFAAGIVLVAAAFFLLNWGTRGLAAKMDAASPPGQPGG
jgi:uncharacterized membrane protein YqhA